MQRLTSYRPTAPVVINLIALFIVLGGHAFALPGKSRVTREDIATGAVTARNLAPGNRQQRQAGETRRDFKRPGSRGREWSGASPSLGPWGSACRHHPDPRERS